MRSGTLNVPGIVGFGKACEICMNEMNKDAEHTSRLRDKLESGLLQIEETYVNGDREHRLPHTTNLSFTYAESEGLLMALVNKLHFHQVLLVLQVRWSHRMF